MVVDVDVVFAALLLAALMAFHALALVLAALLLVLHVALFAGALMGAGLALGLMPFMALMPLVLLLVHLAGVGSVLLHGFAMPLVSGLGLHHLALRSMSRLCTVL